MRFYNNKKYILLDVDYSYDTKEFNYYVDGIYISDGNQIEPHENDWNHDNDIYVERGVYLKRINANYEFINEDTINSYMIEFNPVLNDEIYICENIKYKCIMKFRFAYLHGSIYNKNPLLILLMSNNNTYRIVENKYFLEHFSKN